MTQVCHCRPLSSIRSLGDSIYRKLMIRFTLQDADHTGFADALPGQALYQRLQLFVTERMLRRSPRLAPVELAAVQTPGTQPDAQAVVDQHLHPVGALVGKQIRTMRPGTAKDLNHPRQCRIRASAHIQRLGGQPDLINTDHCNSSRSSARHRSICETGKLMLMLWWR